ncbi:hypothetical protein LOTGIDRAFT_136443 [Lottia gigantea]|uniref:Pyridoxal phosphate phosphatase PHOSPHO2 n=1 Tax=Lottia gigantea TaxID=225164 RepID=V4BEQ9_LOTGI|nr:hypothetical protein LOTGIDRAFT_136443 [Lottia gigantea]ESP04317.1 hypothetical protein LOTGIDRAFT_136443 [Lottia gigantea]
MSEKILLAFDFDHTIIDDNSDIHIINLAPNGKLPQAIKDQYDDDGWTEYMGTIFEYLHENGVQEENIKQNMAEIKLTEGMEKLLDLAKGDKYDSIIISDSNSHFIECILENFKLSSVFSKVFTNPASFDDKGCLKIKFYHKQDYCSLSTINLCKGRILQDFIKDRKSNGVEYSQVVYVGDGSNDLCPGLTLGAQDYLCARKGFSLWKKLNKAKKSKTKDEFVHSLKAQVFEWQSGEEIKDLLEKL